MTTIRKQVIEIIAEVSGFEVEDIDTAKSLSELGFDSIASSEALMNIEDDTGVAIPENEWQQFKTVEDIINFVEAKA